MSNNNYPLAWPDGWTRTKHPGKSKFKKTLPGALANVEKSLELFAKDSKEKIAGVVISSNVTLGSFNPKDAGVAVYFEWSGIATCIAVDRYLKVEENLQAIHHCIEAERVKLRHGGINLVRAAFRGYASLPPPGSGGSLVDWWVVLGVKKDAPRGAVEQAYKSKRGRYHPDKPTGNAARFQAVQQAWSEYNNQ